MKKIVIIGSSGSGKSTLSRALSTKLNLPVVHLDKLFWKPNWVESSKEEFDKRLEIELQQPSWIMDGNFDRTMPIRIEKCDTLIYLDYPRMLCLFSAIKRVITTYGKVRPDMGEECPQRFDFSFLVWIWNFNKVHRKQTYKILEGIKDDSSKKLYIFKHRRECNKFLNSL